MLFRSLAQQIAELEGKKEEVNIAQIKEILRCTLDLLAERKVSEVVELLERTRDTIS